MSECLRRLSPAARVRISADFYRGGSAPSLDDLMRPFDRELSLETVRAVFQTVLERANGGGLDPATDAWVAPRLHASLRLTRREAADPSIWAYLAVIEFPDYVRARWGDETGRWFAGEVNQAISRLWWGAEMCRNGADYGPVTTAFSVQDVPNTWFRLDAIHSRPLAIALTRLMLENTPTGRQLNRLATATNLRLTTTVLDALSTSRGSDPDKRRDWCMRTLDRAAIVDESLPQGPEDVTIDEDDVTRVLDLLRELLDAGVAPE